MPFLGAELDRLEPKAARQASAPVLVLACEAWDDAECSAR